MKKVVATLGLLVLALALLMGCGSTAEKDNYNEIRQLAWQYVEEQGWERLVSSSWQSALVEKRVLTEKAVEDAELTDLSYVGEELLWVTFPSGFAPTIIIHEETQEVVGYIQE